MRRALPILLALAAASACASAFALPSVGKSAKKKAFVKLEHCSREDHTAAFYARMRAIEGTERMKLRFTLLERGGDGRFRKVAAPELARWRRSASGVEVFGYHQEVKGLREGRAYRVLVRYRWYGEDGPIKRKRKRSRICRQYKSLPNLRVRALGYAQTSTPGVWRYRFRVRNSGAARATEVPLQFAVDGAVVDSVEAGPLASQESDIVRFRGPPCAHSYSIVADPDGVVNETRESDNRASGDC